MDGVSVAERRREARKRRILENAESRMNRLCGRPDAAKPAENQESAAPPSESVAAADVCPDPPDQLIHEVLLGAARSGSAGRLHQDGLGDLLRQMNGPSSPGAAPGAAAGAAPGTARGAAMAARGPWRLWDRYRWAAVALLALITRLLPLAGLVAAVSQNVLLPFLLLEVTVYVAHLWSVPLRPSVGLLGTALMLCGVSPQTLDLWARYITFLSQAWNDLMVYLFVLAFSFRLIRPADTGRTEGSIERPEMAPAAAADEVNFEF